MAAAVGRGTCHSPRWYFGADVAGASLTSMTALLALVSSLCWGSSDFLGGLTSKRLPSLLVVALSQVVGLLAVGTLALVTGEWRTPLGYIPWAIVAGWAGAAGMVVFYRAPGNGHDGCGRPDLGSVRAGAAGGRTAVR